MRFFGIFRVSISLMILVIVPWSIVLVMCLRVHTMPRPAAFDAADIHEIQKICHALESHRARYGDYPPDFSSNDPTAEIREHLQVAFPLRDHANDVPQNVDALTPADALHFWLNGLYTKNPYFPVTGKYDQRIEPMTKDEMFAEIHNLDSIKLLLRSGVEDISKTREFQNALAKYQLIRADQVRDRNQFLDVREFYRFNSGRLSGNHRYALRGSKTPLVYFRSGGYDDASFEGDPGMGVARPYQSLDSKPAFMKFEKPFSFQIVSAGKDGHFGMSSIRAVDAHSDDSHSDNLTNLSSTALGAVERQRQIIQAIRQRNLSPFMAIICTLVYPVIAAFRKPEDGLAVLRQSLKKQWNTNARSAAWTRILDRQRLRNRSSAINRLKAGHSVQPQSQDARTVQRL